MSRAHRRFLLLEEGVGSAFVNFAINAAIAWALFRGMERVPLWGDQSIMGDTIATSVILPFITSLIVTPLARRRVRGGHLPPLGWTRASHPVLRWLPRSTALRGLAVGLLGLLVLAPIAYGALAAAGVGSLGTRAFILFKAGYAATEGLLVTPVLALWAIAELPVTRGSGASTPSGADRDRAARAGT